MPHTIFWWSILPKYIDAGKMYRCDVMGFNCSIWTIEHWRVKPLDLVEDLQWGYHKTLEDFEFFNCKFTCYPNPISNLIGMEFIVDYVNQVLSVIKVFLLIDSFIHWLVCWCFGSSHLGDILVFFKGTDESFTEWIFLYIFLWVPKHWFVHLNIWDLCIFQEYRNWSVCHVSPNRRHCRSTDSETGKNG